MINSNDFVVAIIADVKSIMEGPDHKNLTKYILAAISDMARLVKGARETLKMQQSKYSSFLAFGLSFTLRCEFGYRFISHDERSSVIPHSILLMQKLGVPVDLLV